mgnify:CR=1 FL=1|tara:strand:- start:8225 stop:9268 length:1044 start_codon:yes stop_codon:yes gene_type:complete
MKKTIHLDTYQVLTTMSDLTPSVKSGELNITAEISGIAVEDVVKVKKREYAAGTNERVDFTVASPVKGTEYKVTMMIKRGLGEEIERISASIIAANTTANDVATQLRAALNALQGSPVTAAGSAAAVEITLATASGEVAGEGDIVETLVAADNAAGWSVSVGAARVVPYGTGTQVARIDASQKVNFFGTAVSTDNYDEVTFYLKGEGTDRKQITMFLQDGATDSAWAISVLQSLGAAAGATGDIGPYLPTANDGAHKGDVYNGCTLISTAPGAGNADIDLLVGSDIGTTISIHNHHASNALDIDTATVGSKINHDLNELVIPAKKAAIFTLVSSDGTDDHWVANIAS